MKDPYKGRMGRAVVNEAAVRRMRFLHSYKGVSADDLAAEYGIGLDACRRILHWKSWRHVSEVGPGAEEADFTAAVPVDAATRDAAAESLARLQAKLEAEGLSPGLVRLRQEAAKAARPARLLAEVENLVDTREGGVVGSHDGGTPPPTDGGKHE